MRPSQATAADLVQSFQRVFRERMQGLAVVNPALEVEAAGFVAWRDHPLGVIIAPWFLNLVLLPAPGENWSGEVSGTRHRQKLPSGEFTFTVADLDGITYQSCALFTSVLDFPDQATARAVALDIMARVMQPVSPAGAGETGPADTGAISRRELLRRYLG